MRSPPILLALTALIVSAGCPAPPIVEQPGIDEITENLERDLLERGFQVAQGDWRLFRIEDCAFVIQTLGNCLGNNPAAPYVFPTVPLWPDEHVDEDMRDVLGPTPGDTWSTWRLDEREALVVLAQLPPPGRYFGIQTYLWSRVGELNPTDPIFLGLTDPFMRSILFSEAPNPDRVLTFASLGDSNNHAVIEDQATTAFGEARFFIITGDAVMERRLTAALQRAGVQDRDHVFVEPISTDVARLGLDAEADDLMTLIRYALPDDPIAGDAWREQLPLTVLRVRDTRTARATEPYAFQRDERVAVSELHLEPDVDALVTAVKERFGEPDAPHRDFESLRIGVDLVGEHCLARPMNCLGDTGDADYQVSTTVPIDGGEVVAVVGTLGTATGNATYTSLSVNWLPPLVGVVNVADPDLEGTAGPFSATVDNTEQLYVHYFARDCADLDPCVVVTEAMVPTGDPLKIVQRNYVVPGSARGADPQLVVNPRIILFGADAPLAHPL